MREAAEVVVVGPLKVVVVVGMAVEDSGLVEGGSTALGGHHIGQFLSIQFAFEDPCHCVCRTSAGVAHQTCGPTHGIGTIS